MRIHRGNKNQRLNQNSEIPISCSVTNLDSLRSNTTTMPLMTSFERKKRYGSRKKEKVTISISCPSSDYIASPTMSTMSSNQASVISTLSREPITLKKSNSTDCPETQNLFRENINSDSPKGEHSPNNSGKRGKRTFSGAKLQVRKFRMETKAAKTLAIIVGKYQ